MIGALLLAAVGIGISIAAGGFSSEDSDPVATPSQTPTGPSDEELANPVACEPDAVELRIDLAGDSLEHGQEAQFPVTVTNTGQVPCMVDIGHSDLRLDIYSGDDLTWSTDDCSADLPEHRDMLLDLDTSETVTITWDGNRPDSDGCDAGDVADTGTYRAEAVLDLDGDEAEDDQVFGLD